MTPSASSDPGGAAAPEDPPPAYDAEAIAAAAERCPSVARMGGGLAVEVATYLPGRRVRGVRVEEGTVEVHVVARYGSAMPRVAEQVRAAVGPLVDGAPIDVHIDDLDVPGLDEPTAPVAALPPAQP